MKALLPILLMIALVAPANANNEILQDVQVSGLRVKLERSHMTSTSYFYEYCRGRRYRDTIDVNGVINSDTAFIIGNMLKRISETMECSPRKQTPVPMVFLNSNGGSVYDGFEIGNLFNQYRVHAVVLGWDGGYSTCASSCAIAFLGAPYRSMDGRMVFHAPYTYVGNSRQINCKNTAVNDDLKGYYRHFLGNENGDRLYDRTMRYCSTDDGWTVNEDAALMYGIANWDLQ
jgi:ATP-dependent protease ClpP protease subunit